VNPALLTITANSTSKTYGQTVNFAGNEFTTSGLLNSDTVTSANISSAGAPATANVSGSPYDVNISNAQGSGLSNYTIAYNSGSMTVSPALLTITANSGSKTYGQTLNFVGNEFTTSGLLNGDIVSNVNLSSPGALSSATVSGGPYVINVSNASGTPGLASNYNINYVTGSLSVNSASLIITANNIVKTYGQTIHFNGTEFSTNGLASGDTISSVDLASLGAAATATVNGSPYTITIANSIGTNLANYNITYVPGTISVNPAPLTIIANNISKNFGATYTFSGTEFRAIGLQNGDQNEYVQLSSKGATSSARQGAYLIVPSGTSGGSLDQSNYTVTYVNGILMIPTSNEAANVITQATDNENNAQNNLNNTNNNTNQITTTTNEQINNLTEAATNELEAATIDTQKVCSVIAENGKIVLSTKGCSDSFKLHLSAKSGY
jgi:hypothetical protein